MDTKFIKIKPTTMKKEHPNTSTPSSNTVTTRESALQWWYKMKLDKCEELVVKYQKEYPTNQDIEFMYLSEHPIEAVKEESSNREEGFTPDEIYFECCNWFEKRQIVLSGINAGRYLDREDFETNAKWIKDQFLNLKQENKGLKEERQILLDALRDIINNWNEKMSGDIEVWKDGKDSVSGMGYYSPSSSMVSSEFIAKAREALKQVTK